MAEALITPRMRGFLSLSAHPAGCAQNVRTAIERIEAAGLPTMDGVALVLGCSTGYGLATLLETAFGHRMHTIGVCLERGAERGRTASAGWYHMAEASRAARERGLRLEVLNADCFATQTKEQAMEVLSERLGQARLVLYSVAAPLRIDPVTGERHRSVLKPVGSAFRSKALRLDADDAGRPGGAEVVEVQIESADPEEIRSTEKVMGGEDWELWLHTLARANLLAEGVCSVAYTYIGPDATSAIYRSGTIGLAKAHLEATALRLSEEVAAPLGGAAWTSVNGAAITQASTAIPAVPLYLSLLLAAAGEGFRSVEEQIGELFPLLAGSPSTVPTDPQGRIRLDGWELEESLQEEILRRLDLVETETLGELADLEGFRRSFRRLFGFDVEGISYEVPVPVDVAFDGSH